MRKTGIKRAELGQHDAQDLGMSIAQPPKRGLRLAEVRAVRLDDEDHAVGDAGQ